ncbi:FdhF/YdeP family oxidoreductase [Sediminitomix flava]|uniref:Molybdopterin-dependent oxidoreductase alpha subunit n=1 Tax=Sediminitomix flava TaxID=379075 RepID=A0A315ZBF6_SEDFL|nr:FdhF/YdeP family oxidoreductase [Sediminitomix flava]PWJ42632.1 molybdopterin-dependent oxidoreductase alpha subunit [Sediminitomix flava]
MSAQESKKLTIKPVPHSAAGMNAVFIALKMANKAMSPSKAFKILNKLNQKDGVDCPGCAWPDPKDRSKLGEYCENGVKAIAEEAQDKKANEGFFEKYSVAELLDKGDYWLGHQGRLTHPMVIRKGESHYQPISWEKAFQMIATELKSLPNPDEAIFYTSGRTSNEAAFLYQLFVRMYGTNNLPDCSNMCHESSGVALSETLGIGKGSVTLDDLYHAEVILIVGQNPGTNHPRMLSALEKAKKNGAKIVTINPLKEVGLLNFKNPQTVKGVLQGGTDLTDLYLQININEDVALLKALLIGLLEKSKIEPSVIDQEFINSKTSGFEELEKELSNYDYHELIERTGLELEMVEQLLDLLSSSNKIIACWAMGLTQHVNAVDNIREIVNLLLLKGSVGKKGAGTCPVRGHSNVQGDRTMGIHERPSKALLDKLAERFGFIPPKQAGYNVVEAIEAMHEEKGKVFFAMGGNFLPAAPDTAFTAQALQNCKMTVHVSNKLNRSHLVHGDIGVILPTLGRTDKLLEQGKPQLVTVENSMGVVHTSQGMINPPSDTLMSEPAIIARLAKKTLGSEKLDWDELIRDYNNIRKLISQTIKGFEEYNEKIERSSGFALPNGAREGVFNTDTKKAKFTINALSEVKLSADEFMMMTIRSHDQFNTTIYGLNDRYRGVHNSRKIIFMNKEDMNELGLKKEQKITLFNEYEGKRREVDSLSIIPYDIPRKCLATYFPECNPLIPITEIARASHTPASKSVKVKIKA